MITRLVTFAFVCLVALGQQPQFTQGIRWSATTGSVALVSSTYAATVQQPATNQDNVFIDQIVVYCSAACVVNQAANGTAATTTAVTVNPILPTQLNITPNVKAYKASNVGTGTTQGGSVYIAAGATAVLCLAPSCGNPAQVILGTGNGAASNYTLSIESVSATVNITFYGRI